MGSDYSLWDFNKRKIHCEEYQHGEKSFVITMLKGCLIQITFRHNIYVSKLLIPLTCIPWASYVFTLFFLFFMQAAESPLKNSWEQRKATQDWILTIKKKITQSVCYRNSNRNEYGWHYFCVFSFMWLPLFLRAYVHAHFDTGLISYKKQSQYENTMNLQHNYKNWTNNNC